MPSFSDSDIAVLKAAALVRVPSCCLTKEDVDRITDATGLNKKQVDMWMRHFRFRIPIDQRESCLRSEKITEVKEQIQVKRCYIMAFNVTPILFERLSFPKARGRGEFKQKFIFAGLSSDTESAECFIEFHEQIRVYQVVDRLTALGARQVNVVTFQNMDAGESASDALARIFCLESKEAVSFIKRGKCSPDIYRRAQSKSKRARQGQHLPQATDEEFFEMDVVKKRQRMNVSTEDNDSSPDALKQFMEFEQHTMPALLAVHANDMEFRAAELVALEEDLISGTVSLCGGVYFARCSAIAPLKIGCTRRSDPSQRLYELSRCVPEPFKLVAWIPTERPFQLERQVHEHFANSRLRVPGACTEFFSISDDEVHMYVANVSAA